MQNKTLYIIGAGCSTEDGVPLINNFLPEMFECLSSLDTKDSSYLKYLELARFHNNFFPSANIEELLSYIDLHIGLSTNLSGYNLLELREYLIFLIGKFLEIKLKGNWKSKNYSSFIANYIKEEDVVISFNWDIMLDNIKLSINYGVKFNSFDLETEEASEVSNSGFKLLKLHGSLNWLYCEECDERFVTYRKKVTSKIDIKKISCPYCKKNGKNNLLRPIIIPPTFMKYIGGKNSDKAVITIWKEALKELVLANKVVIIGFSFGADDVHFKHFLRSVLAIRNRFGSEGPLKIEVINYQKYISQKMDFEKQYEQIFEGLNIEIRPDFIYQKFSEYVSLKP